MAGATDLVGFHINALMALAEALGASGERREATEAATRALKLSIDKEDLMDERRAVKAPACVIDIGLIAFSRRRSA